MAAYVLRNSSLGGSTLMVTLSGLVSDSPWNSTTTPAPELDCNDRPGIPGVVSPQTKLGLIEFYVRYSAVHGYTSAVICFFGIMSNIANIIVLTRKNMISSTNTILMWLAVADLLTMMSYFPFAIHFYILRDWSLPLFNTRGFGWICFLMFHASFSIVCHTIAIWLTIALAIFRYIYICMPTRGSILCSISRAKKTVLVVYILTFLICIPNIITNRFDFEDYGNVTTDASNVSMATTVSDVADGGHGAGGDEESDIVYRPIQWKGSEAAEMVSRANHLIQAILIKLLPCAMLSTLTILLIHAMHKAYRKRMRLKSEGRKAESDKHGEHNRTTGMLLAVVILFTLTELPQGILTLTNIFIECFNHMVYNPLGDLLDIMALINNSVNFVLYCAMSKQFRDTFVSVFCGCCPKRRPGWLKMKLITSSHNGNVEITSNATHHTHV